LIDHSLRETFLLPQLESPEAIQNADSIAAIEGVDGLFLGPSDLTIRMRLEPPERQISYPETMTRIAAVCEKHGKFWGTTAATTADLRDLRQRKASILMWGYDLPILREGLTRTAQDLDDVLKEQP